MVVRVRVQIERIERLGGFALGALPLDLLRHSVELAEQVVRRGEGLARVGPSGGRRQRIPLVPSLSELLDHFVDRLAPKGQLLLDRLGLLQ